MSIPFEILIDDQLLNVLDPTTTLAPISNKSVMSIVNDYEDKCWRYKTFHRFIWNNIAQNALTKEERDSLMEDPSSVLERAASRLRIVQYDNGDYETTGGEIAEILLYGIMRHYYKALPVVPKIFYKQNKNDYAKGADSVHIVVEDNDNISLWLGEAKFYTKIENSNLDTIVASVHDTLLSDKLRKENSIITGLCEFDKYDEISDQVKCRIKTLLSEETSIDKIKPILHIPIVVLHECTKTKSATELTQEYKIQIIDSHKERAKVYFTKQIEKCSDIAKYSEIKFHLILFPVPNKQRIVDNFIKRAKELRNE